MDTWLVPLDLRRNHQEKNDSRYDTYTSSTKEEEGKQNDLDTGCCHHYSVVGVICLLSYSLYLMCAPLLDIFWWTLWNSKSSALQLILANWLRPYFSSAWPSSFQKPYFGGIATIRSNALNRTKRNIDGQNHFPSCSLPRLIFGSAGHIRTVTSSRYSSRMHNVPSPSLLIDNKCNDVRHRWCPDTIYNSLVLAMYSPVTCSRR